MKKDQFVEMGWNSRSDGSACFTRVLCMKRMRLFTTPCGRSSFENHQNGSGIWVKADQSPK